jgi:salicylate hydroxylase
MKIGIIGCGPGGLASALFLHRAGHDVTLFDQFDAPRPLGSGLLIQPSGQGVLDRLGLLERIKLVAAPVMCLYGVNVASGKRALDMQYRHLGKGACAYGIHRASLFDILFQAVKSEGIEIRPNHRLVSALEQDGKVLPLFDQIGSEAFDLLVDAGGTHSPLAAGHGTQLPFAALWTTVDMPVDSDVAAAALDQRYLGARKMAGIMPVGINPESGNAGAALFWSIRPDEWPKLKARGLSAWQDEFCDLWPAARSFVGQIKSFDELTLALYRHRTGQPVTDSRIFHIGDSWHSTSPQLGQGANMALFDSEALATAVGEASDLAEIARRYRHARSDHVALYQALSYVFTPLYQSNSAALPVLRDTIIHHAARLPLVRSIIAHIVSGNLGRFG